MNKNTIYKLIICGLVIANAILIAILFINKNKDEIVTLNTANICINNTYDGNAKVLTELSSNDKYTILNNQATNAGEHVVTIKLNKGYAWDSKSKEDKKIKCTINKAEPSLIINKESLTVNKNSKSSITIDTNVNGQLTFTTDENKIKLDKKEITKDNSPVTLNITAISNSNAEIQITFKPTDSNYDQTSKTIHISASNNETKKVSPPTNVLCNDLTYNGKSQKLVSKTDYDEYTLKGTLEGTNVGNYPIEAELKAGYIWSDGKKDNKTITCTIKEKEKQYSLTMDKTSCKAGESIYLVIKSKNNTENIYDSIKTINNNSVITSVTQNSACKDNAYYKGHDNSGVGVQASCIFPGQYEVECLKPGNDTITFTTDNNEKLEANITVNSGDVVSLGTNKQRYDGISCVKGKEVTIRVNTYRDGVAKNILKDYSVKNTKYATVSKSSNQPSCTGCTNLTIKCINNGDTSLVITTNDGTKQTFPIIQVK